MIENSDLHLGFDLPPQDLRFLEVCRIRHRKRRSRENRHTEYPKDNPRITKLEIVNKKDEYNG